MLHHVRMDMKDKTYSRRQFLAYRTTIAHERPVKTPKDVDLDEELTFAQWQDEQQEA